MGIDPNAKEPDKTTPEPSDAARSGKRQPLRFGEGVALAVLAITIVIWAGIPTVRKFIADAEVKRLCAVDGGMKIYETVKWPPDRFDRGLPRFRKGWLPPREEQMTATDEFYFTWDTTWLIPQGEEGALTSWRSHQRLFRASDKKLLGEAISYSRRGGDPLGPWHPSSFGCPADVDITVVIRQVFVPQ